MLQAIRNNQGLKLAFRLKAELFKDFIGELKSKIDEVRMKK